MILGWLLIAFAAAVQIFRKCSGIGVAPAEMVVILEKQKK